MVSIRQMNKTRPSWFCFAYIMALLLLLEAIQLLAQNARVFSFWFSQSVLLALASTNKTFIKQTAMKTNLEMSSIHSECVHLVLNVHCSLGLQSHEHTFRSDLVTRIRTRSLFSHTCVRFSSAMSCCCIDTNSISTSLRASLIE